MKTYAICSTPQELRAKLVAYYAHKSETAKFNAKTRRLKRDKDNDEYAATLYMQISLELSELEIDSEPPKFSGFGAFI